MPMGGGTEIDTHCPAVQRPGPLVHVVDVHHAGILRHSLQLHVDLKGLLEVSD